MAQEFLNVLSDYEAAKQAVAARTKKDLKALDEEIETKGFDVIGDEAEIQKVGEKGRDVVLKYFKDRDGGAPREVKETKLRESILDVSPHEDVAKDLAADLFAGLQYEALGNPDQVSDEDTEVVSESDFSKAELESLKTEIQEGKYPQVAKDARSGLETLIQDQVKQHPQIQNFLPEEMTIHPQKSGEADIIFLNPIGKGSSYPCRLTLSPDGKKAALRLCKNQDLAINFGGDSAPQTLQKVIGFLSHNLPSIVALSSKKERAEFYHLKKYSVETVEKALNSNPNDPRLTKLKDTQSQHGRMMYAYYQQRLEQDDPRIPKSEKEAYQKSLEAQAMEKLKYLLMDHRTGGKPLELALDFPEKPFYEKIIRKVYQKAITDMKKAVDEFTKHPPGGWPEEALQKLAAKQTDMDYVVFRHLSQAYYPLAKAEAEKAARKAKKAAPSSASSASTVKSGPAPKAKVISPKPTPPTKPLPPAKPKTPTPKVSKAAPPTPPPPPPVKPTPSGMPPVAPPPPPISNPQPQTQPTPTPAPAPTPAPKISKAPETESEILEALEREGVILQKETDAFGEELFRIALHKDFRDPTLQEQLSKKVARIPLPLTFDEIDGPYIEASKLKTFSQSILRPQTEQDQVLKIVLSLLTKNKGTLDQDLLDKLSIKKSVWAKHPTRIAQGFFRIRSSLVNNGQIAVDDKWGTSYRKEGDEIYYKTGKPGAPSTKKLWTSASENDLFCEHKGGLLRVKKLATLSMYASEDDRVVFDSNGDLLKPNDKGVYKSGENFFTSKNNKWELCDTEGKTFDEHKRDLFQKLKDSADPKLSLSNESTDGHLITIKTSSKTTRMAEPVLKNVELMIKNGVFTITHEGQTLTPEALVQKAVDKIKAEEAALQAAKEINTKPVEELLQDPRFEKARPTFTEYRENLQTALAYFSDLQTSATTPEGMKAWEKAILNFESDKDQPGAKALEEILDRRFDGALKDVTEEIFGKVSKKEVFETIVREGSDRKDFGVLKDPSLAKRLGGYIKVAVYKEHLVPLLERKLQETDQVIRLLAGKDDSLKGDNNPWQEALLEDDGDITRSSSRIKKALANTGLSYVKDTALKNHPAGDDAAFKRLFQDLFQKGQEVARRQKDKKLKKEGLI